MFSILFGWRNASKCKKLIKRVQCRIKLLKNKRICIVKQLREDVAHLLKHSHHPTAFQRVEQVVIDEKMIQVYDLLYQFCEFVIINLPYIRRHRDCPNDIKEAVSALIFSSSRFGELPELLSLRNLFAARYGQNFVAAALPGTLVTAQIVEYLDMKTVPNDIKYKFLDEISRTCLQTEQLFLEYKPELQENENANGWKLQMDDQNDVVPGHEVFGLRKEGCFGNDNIETCSESSAKLGEEVVYLDDIEEYISPVIKDGSLQDQRLFVFKSFGVAKTESKNSIMSQRKRSRKRSLIHGTLNAAHDEFVSYYGESDESSPEIRRKSHHQRGRRDFLVKPRPPYFSVGEIDAVVEAEEFSWQRHLERDDAAGKLAPPPTMLRAAITMPCERRRESNVTDTINRSNSYPFSQSYEVSSPCRHIHPKLPDYDELAAKFMELKRANLEKNQVSKSS